MNRPLTIYHGNCADGFTAAWIINKALNGNSDFHPGIYGQDPPEVEGRDVILTDFSYKRPVLLKMAERAKSILILDHHVSAQKDLVDLPENVTSIFDMDRSGAGITWDYYFPLMARPEFVNHVEDRDLWRFALPHTKEIQASIFSYEYTFENWDKFEDSQYLRSLITGGEAIERKLVKDCHELIAAGKQMQWIGGYYVPVLNVPYMMSSVAAGILCKGQPFAGAYWDRNDDRMFSLRSTEDGIDVSLIAAQYGGGGHKHAAGFTIKRPTHMATSCL
jgi:hypothetical protein